MTTYGLGSLDATRQLPCGSGDQKALAGVMQNGKTPFSWVCALTHDFPLLSALVLWLEVVKMVKTSKDPPRRWSQKSPGMANQTTAVAKACL